MKRQNEIAKELGISKSYLSMILSGKRKCSPDLAEKLQKTVGIHKVVNTSVWNRLYTRGSEVRVLYYPPYFCG
jgi:transcriptional regulator with XRE-family HTH domain